ncbi:hypothetical protein ACNOYE_02155 [Nannocystaceae bacterium ST9]
MAKLVCTLEMSKERGVTITVANADGEITQTITMNGTSVVMKVAGKQDTSTLTQTADAIKIACKDFEIVASNSIACTATQTISLESKQGDTTLTSGAKLTQKATGDVAISGANAAITATSAAKLEGGTADVTATQSTLTLKGTAEAKLSGPSVSVSADGTLSLKSSGVASLEGSATNIKGSLIKAG